MQVGDPLLGLVALRWRVAATFAMAAGIKAQRRIAFADQAAGGALPRLSGLPETMCQQHPRAACRPALGDRKRAVTGKRVSVRVDLGGRRIIKKKKKLTQRKVRGEQ